MITYRFLHSASSFCLSSDADPDGVTLLDDASDLPGGISTLIQGHESNVGAVDKEVCSLALEGACKVD
jgi:hypothetical protein